MNRRSFFNATALAAGALLAPAAEACPRRRRAAASCPPRQASACGPTRMIPGWASAAAGVASAILDRQAARAWDARFTRVTQDTIQELTQRFQDAVNRARIGRATSDFQNATRQMAYYRNDPRNRVSSLHDAEVLSGAAMFELQQMGLFSLHTWLLSAELQMAVLQEWLVLHRTRGAQANINLHYDSMLGHYTAMHDEFLHGFQYCYVDWGGGQMVDVYCGFDPIHIPDPAELDAQYYVAAARQHVGQMARIVVR